jgi:glycosyltransferase involved in cell wall biosynthesis
MPLARALGVPLVVTLHGADITVRGAAERYRALAEQAAAFICVSGFIRDRALEAGLPAEKLRVHYIGIDRKLFVPAPEGVEPTGVLFVGRLVEKKGCEYLIRAMAEVQRAHPDASLTVVGDGPLRPALEQEAARLGVDVQFLGILPPDAVKLELRRASVFCVPSVEATNGDCEGLGMVFIEAAAMGVPVVSTRHGGIPEAVSDGNTGLLVPEKDVLSLAAALERTLRDVSFRQQLSVEGQRFVERRFDLAGQTAGLETLYDEVVRL